MVVRLDTHLLSRSTDVPVRAVRDLTFVCIEIVFGAVGLGSTTVSDIEARAVVGIVGCMDMDAFDCCYLRSFFFRASFLGQASLPLGFSLSVLSLPRHTTSRLSSSSLCSPCLHAGFFPARACMTFCSLVCTRCRRISFTTCRSSAVRLFGLSLFEKSPCCDSSVALMTKLSRPSGLFFVRSTRAVPCHLHLWQLMQRNRTRKVRCRSTDKLTRTRCPSSRRPAHALISAFIVSMFQLRGNSFLRRTGCLSFFVLGGEGSGSVSSEGLRSSDSTAMADALAKRLRVAGSHALLPSRIFLYT